MTNRTLFSQHEAIILLDDYLKGVDIGETKTQTAKRVSDDLRTLAANNGMTIGDSYRSVPGILNRLASMECALEGTTKSSVQISDLFLQVADMYKHNKVQYERLLSEAREMIDMQTNGAEKFIEWVSQSVPGKKTSWLKSNLLRVESLGNARKILNGSIFDVVDGSILAKLRKEMRSNRLFQLSCGKLLKSIVEDFELYCRYRIETAEHDEEELIEDTMRLTSKKDSEPQDILRDTIVKNYPGGLRFDDTVLRLLSEATGTKVNRDNAELLQKEMFRRSDGLFFFPEMIATKEASENIKRDLLAKLTCYALAEVAVLFDVFQTENGMACLRNEEDYAAFLEYLLADAIRIASIYGSRIVKNVGVTVSEATNKLTRLLVETVKNGGCVPEEDLLMTFPVISGAFLKKLLEKNTDEVFATSINGIICYQTIEAMGFDESFSEMLNSTIDKIEELSIVPTMEAIHVLLSMEIGQNFREAYGIPDDKTFRRIVSMYYSGDKTRAWKAGSFMEENSNNV